MTSSKNAARVTVQAQPCPSQSASVWPTWQQAMHVSLILAEDSLQFLADAGPSEPDLQKRDFHAECAVELALAHVRRMRERPPLDHEAFERQWHMATAALHLAHGALPAPRSRLGRGLKRACMRFELLMDLVECVAWPSRHGD